MQSHADIPPTDRKFVLWFILKVGKINVVIF